MKFLMIILISAASLFAMPSINKDNKFSRTGELSGGKSFSKNESYSDTDSKSRSLSQSKSSSVANSRSWTKTLNKNKGYTLTRNGLLAVNVNVFPIIFKELRKKINTDMIKYAKNVQLADLGFDGMGSNGMTNNMAVNFYNSMTQRGANVNEWDDDGSGKTEKDMKYVLRNLAMMAYTVDYIANRLSHDDDLNIVNIEDKIDQLIESAVEHGYKKAVAEDIEGDCYFSTARSWSCADRWYTLELDNAGRPILNAGNMVMWSPTQVMNKSLNMSVTLGHSLSEGLSIASIDSKSRNEAEQAQKALNLVKTKGKSKTNVASLSKTLNKLLKESSDSSVNQTLSTNPIK